MGIEPITYHLQGGCSTIELRRRPGNIALLNVTHRLKSISKFARLRKADNFQSFNCKSRVYQVKLLSSREINMTFIIMGW